MALINCTECSKKISSSATRCPNCGYDGISKDWKRELKYTGYVFIALMLGLLWVVIPNYLREGEVHFKLFDKVKKDKIVYEKILSYKHMLNSDGKYYDKRWCVKGCKNHNSNTIAAIRKQICDPLLRKHNPNYKYTWSCEIYADGAIF